MLLDFGSFLGLVFSWFAETFSLTLFSWTIAGVQRDIVLGQVVLFCIVTPVMYKLLFPSPS